MAQQSILCVSKHWLYISRKVIDPSIDDNCAIKWASKNGYVKVVESLLRNPKVYTYARPTNGVIIFGRRKHKQVVVLLLRDKRVDPSAENNWALRHCWIIVGSPERYFNAKSRTHEILSQRLQK